MAVHASEIGMNYQERLGRRGDRAQPFFSFRQLDWIGVERDQASARKNGAEQFHGMAAVTKRGVDGSLARFGRKHFQNFMETDRAMRTGGSFAGSENLFDGCRIFLRGEFLVLLLKASGMTSPIAGTPSMNRLL